ncbi:hypothetical protein COB21_04050 [Candidatus Aerophobetes bacterium]|uniref:Uncharacterized protein n=1 Tax=Aerophobetes bacterium TaxID=2030807 RepID=A0A2A4X2G8_UNCAE|nr:MAG: hypothetical protein COB21_04050 [Candidatus Aerophobetes bacterium]
MSGMIAQMQLQVQSHLLNLWNSSTVQNLASDSRVRTAVSNVYQAYTHYSYSQQPFNAVYGPVLSIANHLVPETMHKIEAVFPKIAQGLLSYDVSEKDLNKEILLSGLFVSLSLRFPAHKLDLSLFLLAVMPILCDQLGLAIF